MNVKDMMEYLKGLSKSNTDFNNSADTLKCGSWNKEINKVAVTMIATVGVITPLELEKRLDENFGNLKKKYFNCGEVYTYTK